MPIKSNEYDGRKYKAFDWEVIDQGYLEKCIALLMVGHYYHVHRILVGLSSNELNIQKASVSKAIAELSKTDKGNLENRDGWLFQFISWIVITRRAGEKVLIDAPHPIPSHKGFDGLGIRISTNGDRVVFVLLSEDKATHNPRSTFTQKVVPEIADIEAGSRDNQILTGVTTLVKGYSNDDSVRQKLLASALFGKHLRFRVCILTGRSDLPKKVELFADFEECVDGHNDRRGGELLVMENMRGWLQEISENVIKYLKTIPG